MSDSDQENIRPTQNNSHTQRIIEKPSVSVLHRGGFSHDRSIPNRAILKKSASPEEDANVVANVNSNSNDLKSKLRSRSSDCHPKSANKVYISQINLDLNAICLNKRNSGPSNNTAGRPSNDESNNASLNHHCDINNDKSTLKTVITPCACSQYKTISVHEMHKCIFLCNEKDTNGKICREINNPNVPHYVMTSQSHTEPNNCPLNRSVSRSNLSNKETQTNFIYYVEQPMMDLLYKSYNQHTQQPSSLDEAEIQTTRQSRQKSKQPIKKVDSSKSIKISETSGSSDSSSISKKITPKKSNKTPERCSVTPSNKEKRRKSFDKHVKSKPIVKKDASESEEFTIIRKAASREKRSEAKYHTSLVKRRSSTTAPAKGNDKSSDSPSFSENLIDQPMSEIQKLLDSLNAQLQIRDTNVNYSQNGDVNKIQDVFWDNPLKAQQDMRNMYTPVNTNRSVSQVSRHSHHSMAAPNSELEPIYGDIPFESPEPLSKATPRSSSVNKPPTTRKELITNKTEKGPPGTQGAAAAKRATVNASESPDKTSTMKFVKTFDLDPYDEMVKSHKNSNDRRLKSVASKNGCNIYIEGPVRVYDNNQTCVAMRNKTCYRCYVGSTNKEKLEKCVNYLKETFPNTFLKVKLG